MNIAESATLLILTIPYVLQVLSEILVKFVVWPWDLYYFAGKCSFRLAYPSYLSIYLKDPSIKKSLGSLY